jgi:primosomal protein N' (replication factor Y)
MYASIAADIAADKIFTYAVPESLAGVVAVGQRVVIPLGRRRATGFIIGLSASPPEAIPVKIREIAELSDREPLFGAEDLEFYRWISRYYLYPLGKAIAEIIPAAKKMRRKRTAVPSGESEGLQTFQLNHHQERAKAGISELIRAGGFHPVVLHGVTGSGKTEIYLHAMAEVLKTGGSVLFLVPEIALTPQLLNRICARAGQEEIAVLHSDIAPSIRYSHWQRIRRGEIRLVAGARSALFAPLRDLRLIVVDEEHDTSYKQDDRLPYHARDLAIMRAKLAKALVILGSATPSMQTLYHAKKQKYRLFSLPERVAQRPLPDVEIIDMRDEKDTEGRILPLSALLQGALKDTLNAGRQALLFLNRRGFHTIVFCQDCRHRLLCPACAVAMTHHVAEGVLKCHYCGRHQPVPTTCPACRGSRIRHFGLGTERLEAEVRRLFPDARTARMDSDTTVHKGAHEAILKSLRGRHTDILVGTQMITKGHDLPDIALVGVVCADLSLDVPDFRAAERTFQLLTQVSGRGGRGDFPGQVIIQTFNPEHYAILHAKNHDCESFYSEEIRLRKSLLYPPFSRLVVLQLSALRKDRGQAAIEHVGAVARHLMKGRNRQGRFEIIGPVEAPLAKLRGRYRWHLLIKGQDIRLLHEAATMLRDQSGAKGLTVKVDVDPMNFM